MPDTLYFQNYKLVLLLRLFKIYAQGLARYEISFFNDYSGYFFDNENDEKLFSFDTLEEGIEHILTLIEDMGLRDDK